MAKVLLARDSDSKGYTHLILADPIGATQAGAEVVAELPDGGEHRIVLHGQRELDVPTAAVKVKFPDGKSWTPKK